MLCKKCISGSVFPPLMALIMVLAVALCGCSTHRRTFYADDIYGDKNRVHTPTPATPGSGHKKPGSKAGGYAGMVIAAAERWLGTPYQYGGNSKGGTDCSGLTTMAFLEGAGIKLPRSSNEQAAVGKAVKFSDLRPGDLVFFTNKKGGGRINHVAIYAGDGCILHATTSLGVCYTDMEADLYWAPRYHSARRVLAD